MTIAIFLLPFVELVFTACDTWTATVGSVVQLDLRSCPAQTIYECDQAIVVEDVLVGIDCCERSLLFRNGFDVTTVLACP